MIEYVEKASALIEERSELDSQIADLIKPVLTDRGFIPVIYDRFKDILSERNCPPYPESPYQRKKILFIIIKLYCPGLFVGMKMANGLRSDIAKTLNIKSESVISADCTNLIFLYEHYSDFRDDVDELYKKITEGLGDG
jgi:hypothetical protein